jgi:hypothetical protein
MRGPLLALEPSLILELKSNLDKPIAILAIDLRSVKDEILKEM